MTFKLPPLQFDPTSFGEHISAETFAFHHGKHHKAYVDKTNELLAAAGQHPATLNELIMSAPAGKLFNQSAQIWNHSFFWLCLTPKNALPEKALADRLNADFGSFEAFIAAFVEAGGAHFGSGWVWLVEQDGKLKIVAYHDADTPIAHEGVKPLLTIDVWEHAYYIDYRNARANFIEAMLRNCVNWEFVAQNLDGLGATQADQAF